MLLMRNVCMIILFIVLAGSADAGAVSSITINPSAVDGVYIVTAADVYDASGIDFSFSYDTATLANPKVTPGPFALGSSAMMVDNTTTAGIVRVAFIAGNGFKGTGGQLATITFNKVGKLSGRLFGLNSIIYSTAAAKVATQSIIGTATSPVSDTATDDGTAKGSSPSPSGGMSTAFNQAGQQSSSAPTPTGQMNNIYTQAQQQQQTGSYLGNVTYSGNSPIQQETRRDEPKRDDSPRAERTSDAPQEAPRSIATHSASSEQTDNLKTSKAKSAKEALLLLKSVEMPVQRFRTFKGARTVKGLAPLFDNEAALKAGIAQTPEIAVSDGKTKITLRIELAASGAVPNFSLRGANLKSIKPITDKAWELDALPKKGKYDVDLSVLMGSEHADIQLVVIPPLEPSISREAQGFSEVGVNSMLAKAESKGKVVYDLNDDGRQDFMDDYILIAHYLLKKQKQHKPAQKK